MLTRRGDKTSAPRSPRVESGSPLSTGKVETVVGVLDSRNRQGEVADRANGHVVLKNFDLDYPGEQQGKVVCIQATGNVATVVYQMTKSDSVAGNPGDYRKLRLEDNGNPSGGQPVDRIQSSGVASPVPLDCETPILARGGVITSGNIRVVDGD